MRNYQNKAELLKALRKPLLTPEDIDELMAQARAELPYSSHHPRYVSFMHRTLRLLASCSIQTIFGIALTVTLDHVGFEAWMVHIINQ